MVTQTNALEWLKSQVGQKLDYDHKYGLQCVDFFNFYYQYITGDNAYADGYGVPDAKDLWNVPNGRLEKLPDSRTLTPQPGDILVYNSTWGAGAGHVEICESSDANGSHMIGENEHGNIAEGVIRVYRTWAQMRGLIGIMRPQFVAPVVDPPANAPATTSEPNYDGHSITIQPGWGLSNAAEAAGFPDAGNPGRWANIASLNGSSDWQSFNHNLKTGQRIVVGKYEAPAAPAAPEMPQKPANIVFTRFDQPQQLMTNKDAHKWDLSFDVDHDAVSVEDLPAGTVFTAVGKGQRTDHDKPVYFMSAEDFGNADTTGLPNRNVGVNTVDLSPAPTPPAPATDSADGEKIPVIVDWKSSFNSFLSPQEYIANKNIVVKDLEEQNPDVQLIRSQPVMIAGSFSRSGVKYLRTAQSVAHNVWYGIPEEDADRKSDLQEDNLMEEMLHDAPRIRKELSAQNTKEKVLEAVGSFDGLVSRAFHRNKNKE